MKQLGLFLVPVLFLVVEINQAHAQPVDPPGETAPGTDTTDGSTSDQTEPPQDPAPDEGSEAGTPGSETTPAPRAETAPPAEAVAPPSEPAAGGFEVVSEVEEEEEEELVVIAATKTPQSVDEAPSIVTVISRDQIATQGYLTLGEILRNTVGFGVNDNGHWPDTGIRGINDRTTYGDKIKMLIDGHNMAWRQFNRNYYDPSWIAMNDIARIEIIRGPGGALWGSNALTGIVNIISKDWTNVKGAEIQFGADHRFATQMLSAQVGKEVGDFGFYAALSYYYDNADSLLPPVREFKLMTGESDFVKGDLETGFNAVIKAKWKWLKLRFSKSRHDTYAPLSTFSIMGGDDSQFITDRYIVGVSFSEMVASGLELSGSFDYDDYRFAEGTQYESNPLAENRSLVEMAAIDRRYEWKLQATYLPTADIQGVAGVDIEYLDLLRWHFPAVWQADNLPEPTFTNFHLGTFLQGQYSPIKLLAITAGARLDYDQVYGSQVTPRAGLVLRLPQGITVKGLFGTGFKAPSFHDLYYFRKNAFYGNPELKPENSITGELMVGYRLAGVFSISATGFYTRINDIIGYVKKETPDEFSSAQDFPDTQRPDGTKSYSQKTNLDHVRSYGVEAEAQLEPLKWLDIRLSGTYRRPENHEAELLDYASQWTFGGSLTVKLPRKVRATVRVLGVGEKAVPAHAFSGAGYPNWGTDGDLTLVAPAYAVGTFILRAQDVFTKGFDLRLKMDNFTNSEHFDAGRELLYPQPKFQAMLWGTLSL